MISYTQEEIDQDRRDALLIMCTNHEKTIPELRQQYENDFGHHESLHVASIMMEIVESYLIDHPTVVLDEQSYRLAHEAHTALFNLYQRLGELRFKDDPKPISPDQAGWENVWWRLRNNRLSPELTSQIKATMEVFYNDEEDRPIVNIDGFERMISFLEMCPQDLLTPSLSLSDKNIFALHWTSPDHSAKWQVQFDYHGDGTIRTMIFRFNEDGGLVSVGPYREDPSKVIIPAWVRRPVSPEETGCANDCTHPDHYHG